MCALLARGISVLTPHTYTCNRTDAFWRCHNFENTCSVMWCFPERSACQKKAPRPSYPALGRRIPRLFNSGGPLRRPRTLSLHAPFFGTHPPMGDIRHACAPPSVIREPLRTQNEWPLLDHLRTQRKVSEAYHGWQTQGCERSPGTRRYSERCIFSNRSSEEASELCVEGGQRCQEETCTF